MTKADHYPVKERGQKRTLNPNRDAIRWLESEAHDDTEISQVYSLGAGLKCVRAQGFVKAAGRVGYPRRMFDVFALEASSTMPVSRTACEACDDFSRTWACTEHPSSGPPSPRTTDLYDRMFARPSPGFNVRQADQEEYRRQAALYFQATRPGDPNRDRPGYHYHFPTDRWVPDTTAPGGFRAGGEVGAGFFRGREVSFDEVSADERLAAEWERQNGIPLADVVRQIDGHLDPGDHQ